MYFVLFWFNMREIPVGASAQSASQVERGPRPTDNHMTGDRASDGSREGGVKGFKQPPRTVQESCDVLFD